MLAFDVCFINGGGCIYFQCMRSVRLRRNTVCLLTVADSGFDGADFLAVDLKVNNLGQ